MTDNLPAVPEPTTSREVARADTDSWIGVVGEVSRFASMVASTEFVPSSMRDSPAAVAAAILYGREVGLPPMTALTQTHVIEGRPSMAAEAMRALVFAAGHEIQVIESTGAICRMRGRRRGAETWTPEVVWSSDAARAAGLLGNPKKQNWTKYPRRMLQARATSELCELYFPDVIHGFRSVEEMLDAAEEQAPDERPTSTVSRAPRKRAAGKPKAAQAPTAPAEVTGPPLPGEPGYDTPAETSTGGAEQGEGDAPSVDTIDDSGAVNGAETSSEGQPTTPNHEAGEAVPAAPESSDDQGDDVHDAVIVEDPPDEMCACGHWASEPVDGCDNHPDPVPAEPGPRYANRAQVRALNTILSKSFDVEGDDRHPIASALIGRDITSLNDITAAEISPLLDTLAMLKSRADLDALIEASTQRRTEQ
jgi:hypothetical protein